MMTLHSEAFEKEDRNSLSDLLTTIGIDVSKGLSYANNEWDFYVEMLNCFIEEYHSKYELLLQWKDRIHDGQDLKPFTILVHQLKGESKGIGCMDLGEKFYQLEMASKQNDTKTVLSYFDATLEAWSKLIISLESFLSQADSGSFSEALQESE